MNLGNDQWVILSNLTGMGILESDDGHYALVLTDGKSAIPIMTSPERMDCLKVASHIVNVTGKKFTMNTFLRECECTAAAAGV